MSGEAAALTLPVLCGVGLLGLAFLVARVGWAQRHNKLFATLYLLSGINSVSQGLLTAPADATAELPTWADRFHQAAAYFPGHQGWFAIEVVCTVLMMPLLLLFVLNFPRPAPWVVRHTALQGLVFVPAPFFAAAVLLHPAWLPLQAVQDLFNVVATAVTLAATYLLWRTRALAPSPIERRQAGYLLLGFVPAFAATGAITLLGYLLGQGPALPYQRPILYYIDPPLELAAAAVTAFAILKYRLLDFELKVQGGFRYVLMSVIFFLVFLALDVFVGNLVLQNGVFAFAGPAGSAALGGVTSVVLFRPVHDLSEKVALRLFPDVKDGSPAQRAREIYQAQATHVLRDAKVTDRELSFLRTLREQLGLSATEAADIEEGIERSLGVDSERTGRSALPPVPPPPAAVPPAPARPPLPRAQGIPAKPATAPAKTMAPAKPPPPPAKPPAKRA